MNDDVVLNPLGRVESERRWMLSLAGGGYRGLFTARILVLLEEAIGRPLHEVFDLISGTSIGSILALGVAKGTPASQLTAIFERDGERIFPSQSVIEKALWLVQPKYGTAALHGALKTVLGEDGFGTLRTRVIIPAVRATDGSHTVFRTNNGTEAQSNCTLVDAALASSAAPLYFKPHQITGVMYLDGGLVANKPDMLAAVEASSALRWNLARARMLSIGTTRVNPGLATSDISAKYGIGGWVWGGKLVEQLMAAQGHMSAESAKRLLGESHYEIDAPQSEDQRKTLGLDRATPKATATLKGLAETAWARFSESRDGLRALDELRRHKAGAEADS